jgi:hypothetical protein
MAFVFGQYLRDVLGRQYLTRRQAPTTYVRLSNWGNRHFFLLLRFLSSAEYPCVVGASRPWIVGPGTYSRRMDRYARFAFTLPHVRFSSAPPRDTEKMVLVHDGQWPEMERYRWRATIHVEYTMSLPPPTDTAWRVMPLLMHPLVYATGQDRHIGRLRRNTRTLRMLFAGNVDETAYSSSRSLSAIRARFELLDRPTVVRTLAEGLGSAARWVETREAWEQARNHAAGGQFVLAGRGGFRIPHTEWLDALSRCDVFLAPPGAFFPLCHNLVEAMAVGAIPLTNYADWHDPPLEHLRNCISFTTKEDLLDRAQMVLKMDPTELARMREEVVRYYDRYFNPDAFPRRLLQSPAERLTLFVVTDSQRRWESVTRESVLFARQRGTSAGERCEEREPCGTV